MAKTGIASIAEGRTDLFRMDPSKIEIREGWNSRDFDHPDNVAHVEALAASIREVGIKEPLSGFMEGEVFILTNGESRLRAVRKLLAEGVEIKTIPVLPEPRYASEADHLASQFIRNSGRPFTPMENANLFTRLLSLGWTDKEIAAKTGMTTERVQQIAKLNAVPEDVKKSIRKGEVSATLVQRLQAKGESPSDIKKTVSEAIKTAKAEGKTKATPRHIPGPRTERMVDTMKKKSPTNYRDLFEELMSYITSVETEASGKTDEIVLSIPKARLEVMNAAAKTQGRF